MATRNSGRGHALGLDWWNGNRSLLKDGELTGMILGMTLATRPEEVYRALVEGTAFGARMAIDAFTGHGLTVHSVVCTGGLASDACLLEIYADSLDRELLVAGSEQASAVGAAMLGATAAGPATGGHASLRDASSGWRCPRGPGFCRRRDTVRHAKRCIVPTGTPTIISGGAGRI